MRCSADFVGARRNLARVEELRRLASKGTLCSEGRLLMRCPADFAGARRNLAPVEELGRQNFFSSHMGEPYSQENST